MFILLLFALVAASPSEDTTAANDICDELVLAGVATSTTMCFIPGHIPACSRPGLICDGSNNVIQIKTTVMMTGTFPTELGMFRNLQSLTFGFDLSFPITINLGGLPTQLGMLSNLEFLQIGNGIAINQDMFSGTILPTQIGNLQKLKGIFFYGMGGTFTFPTQMNELQSLEILQFTNAQIANPLPTSLTDLNSLTEFSAIQTAIPGPLPRLGAKPALANYLVRSGSLFSLFDDPLLFNSPVLGNFEISHCPMVAGTIPSTINQAQMLQNFILINTAMSGTLPTVSFGSLSPGLRMLHIEKVPYLSGTFPTDLSYLTNLDEIIFSETRLTGSLPKLFVPTALPVMHFPQSIQFVGSLIDPDTDCSVRPTGHFSIELAEAANLWASIFVLSHTCMDNYIPDVPPQFSARISPVPIPIFILTFNSFSDPLPPWLPKVLAFYVSMGGLCLLQGKFCFKPVPYDYTINGKCTMVTDGVIDACGVCNGDGLSCIDCSGVQGGPYKYDLCDVCGGDSSVCTDCNGVPNGAAVYDQCDVCNGNDDDLDCAGVCGGTSIADRCHVCDGDGQSCLDCSDTLFGTLQYDACDVCGGTGSTCLDCAGSLAGSLVYDICGNCVDLAAPDYRPECTDCEGVAYGTKENDVCGVCDGDGTACLHEIAEQLAGEIGTRRIVPWLIGASILLFLALLFLAVCFVSNRSGGGTGVRRRRPAPAESRFRVYR